MPCSFLLSTENSGADSTRGCPATPLPTQLSQAHPLSEKHQVRNQVHRAGNPLHPSGPGPEEVAFPQRLASAAPPRLAPRTSRQLAPPLARESLLLGGQVRPAFHLSPCFSRLRCLANHRRVGSRSTHLLPHSLCGPGAWYNLTGSCAQGWAGLCSPLVAVVGRILVSVIIGLRSQGCSPLLEATLSPGPRAT